MILFLTLFAYRIQPISVVEPLKFQRRVVQPRAQENFSRLMTFAREKNELDNFDRQKETYSDTELIRRHRQISIEFRQLLEGKRIQVPRKLYPSEYAADSDTMWESVFRLIGAAELQRLAGEMDLRRGDLSSARDRARFLITAGDTLIQSQGTLLFRLIAHAIQEKGLNLFKTILEEGSVAPEHLRDMAMFLKKYRDRKFPYQDLLARESHLAEKQLSIVNMSDGKSPLAERIITVLYSRSFKRYRMIGRRYFHRLVSLSDTPYWKIKKTTEVAFEPGFMEFPTPLNMLIELPHGIIPGILWELFFGSFTPEMIFQSEAEAKTRMNCLLKTIHARFEQPARLPEKFRLDMKTGEPLRAGCLTDQTIWGECGGN